MASKTAVIIGAGPAGLTAAWELLQRTDIHPVVLEQDTCMGGISRTAVYKGNRIDIGGHRFFSKSDRVMNWWLDRLPMQGGHSNAVTLRYQGQQASMNPTASGPDPNDVDRVMLVRSRKSRIYWRRQLFDYPLKLSADTIAKMGVYRTFRAGTSYMRSMAMPIRNELTLEHFLINRFGRELYETFFKSYTEKVWGVPCHEIPADWGAQRIKGLSITGAVKHALGKLWQKSADVSQKNVETSLIEQFLYPKLGPGQMWETVADEVRAQGGQILTGHRVIGLRKEGSRVVAVEAENIASGERVCFAGDHVFSSMPISELAASLGEQMPDEARLIATSLPYRDFFTIGLLADRLKLEDEPGRGGISDNWIYIQEPDVLIGRLQVFNNWSPYMVADPAKTWLGLEYFCSEHDAIWHRPDDELVDLGRQELGRIGIVNPQDVVDGCVIRMKKTYPAYFGTYERFGQVQDWLDGIENLYCLGRNGQHRYNNQDHSMLTAMTAVDNIVAGQRDKSNLWRINTESEYHEERAKSA